MQSIGERLEEARKRRGISVREASEATKIRGDFLLSFENNQFDISLPEIYVRGFLRNYAGFLKIDSEKIVTDYTASALGETKPGGRKDPRELFGRMEIPERQRPAAAEGAASSGPVAPVQRRRPEEPSDFRERAREGANPNLANYFKIGAVILAGVVGILLIVWLALAIINRASGPDNLPGTQANATVYQTKLIATLDTVTVTVTNAADGSQIFRGPLARGEEKSLEHTGAIKVVWDRGEFLQIEPPQGRRQAPRFPGPGSTQITVPER